jgi:restriction system protein
MVNSGELDLFAISLGLPIYILIGLVGFAPSLVKKYDAYISHFLIISMIYIFLIIFIREKLSGGIGGLNQRPPVGLTRQGNHLKGNYTSQKGIRFEKRLKALYERKGYYVEMTPDQGDFGADLILYRDGRKIVVQAKDWEKNKVGIRAVQEINAAIGHYCANEGWVVITNYYTDAARQLADSNNIKIFDRDDLHAFEHTGIRWQNRRRNH